MKRFIYQIAVIWDLNNLLIAESKLRNRLKFKMHNNWEIAGENFSDILDSAQ